jgi:hypothetical protein
VTLTKVTDVPSNTGVVLKGDNMNDEAQFIPLTSGSIAAGKAYLEIETPSPARQLTVKFADDITGISSIENKQASEIGYYNLSGQRIAVPSKGLYIKNGKKVIMK